MPTKPTQPDLAAEQLPESDAGAPLVATRRTFLSEAGRKARYIAPLIFTLTAAQARADGVYQGSCYGAGHACPGAEPCCPPLSCNAGICQ